MAEVAVEDNAHRRVLNCGKWSPRASGGIAILATDFLTGKIRLITDGAGVIAEGRVSSERTGLPALARKGPRCHLMEELPSPKNQNRQKRKCQKPYQRTLLHQRPSARSPNPAPTIGKTNSGPNSQGSPAEVVADRSSRRIIETELDLGVSRSWGR